MIYVFGGALSSLFFFVSSSVAGYFLALGAIVLFVRFFKK